MHVHIHLSNHLIADALHQLLVANGYDNVVVEDSLSGGSGPSLLLVDSLTVRHALLSRYPAAKVLLIDTGLEPERLCIIILSYRLYGVLSSRVHLSLLKEAFSTASKGGIWIDNASLRSLLEDIGTIPTQRKITDITNTEREIIACVCQGLTNGQIARRLALSDHTVKTRLGTIYRKCNVTTRSELISLAAQSQLGGSA